MEKHYGFIYLTIDLKNGKGYVGQHKIKNQETLDPKYFGSGKFIKDILKGNGNDKSRFHRQILCFCESKEELNEMEIYYVNYFNALESESFYNCTEGGNGHSGVNPFANKTDEEMKEIGKKISEKNLGKKKCKLSDEHKQKISNANKGRNPYANKTEEEMKEIKQKMSDSQKGKKFSSEYKQKMSKSLKGKNAKHVYCIELNMVFSSIGQAERYCKNILKIKIGPICFVCLGKLKSTGKLQNGTKLHWKYVEDVDPEILKNAIQCDYEE